MGARERIVDAAMAIVRDQGIARLTVSAAAKQAGLSKGGVLYHFNTKDDLIRGMVSTLIERVDDLSRRYFEAEPDGPYRWARAMVRTAFDPDGPAGDRIGGALVAAIAVDPDLATPLQGKFAEWQAQIRSDSPDPLRAAIVCMAMDGYYFETMMGLVPFAPAELARIERAALDLLS